MLEALVVTLREGVEAALIVGITLAYIAKIGRPDLRQAVYAALGAAAAGSIAAAIALSRLNLNQDIFEGWVMLVAAAFVVTMIVFMMRTGRKLKGQIEGKVGEMAARSSRLGLFAFVFLMGKSRSGASRSRSGTSPNRKSSAFVSKPGRRMLLLTR